LIAGCLGIDLYEIADRIALGGMGGGAGGQGQQYGGVNDGFSEARSNASLPC